MKFLNISVLLGLFVQLSVANASDYQGPIWLNDLTKQLNGISNIINAVDAKNFVKPVVGIEMFRGNRYRLHTANRTSPTPLECIENSGEQTSCKTIKANLSLQNIKDANDYALLLTRLNEALNDNSIKEKIIYRLSLANHDEAYLHKSQLELKTLTAQKTQIRLSFWLSEKHRNLSGVYDMSNYCNAFINVTTDSTGKQRAEVIDYVTCMPDLEIHNWQFWD